MGRATLIGFSAVVMWALLALLTDASGAVPPFLLSALAFSIGAAIGFAARFAGLSAPATVSLSAVAVGEKHAGAPAIRQAHRSSAPRCLCRLV